MWGTPLLNLNFLVETGEIWQPGQKAYTSGVVGCFRRTADRAVKEFRVRELAAGQLTPPAVDLTNWETCSWVVGRK